MGDKLWLKHAEKIAKLVESKRDDMKALSDEALKEKTDEFKARIKQGESLDAILPEAFAVAREAAFRVNLIMYRLLAALPFMKARSQK